MGCRSDYMAGSECDHYEDEIKELKKRLDGVTQFLCYLCGELTEDKIIDKYLDDRLKDWWDRHQKFDTKRVKENISSELKKQGKARDADKLAWQMAKDAEIIHPVSRYHKKWFKKLALEIDSEMLKKEQKILEEQRLKAKNKASALKKLTKAEKEALGL